MADHNNRATGNSDANSHGDVDSRSESNTDGDSDSDGYSDRDADSDGYGYSYGYGYGYGYGDGDSDSDSWWDAMRDGVFAELRWSSSASVACGLGGDQCTGVAPLWVTSATTPDTAPNDAFVDDPATVSDKLLDTPAFAVTGAPAQVSFRNFYNLESTFDGGSWKYPHPTSLAAPSPTSPPRRWAGAL